MSKPTVFFSHSSQDQKPLARLKEIFCTKSGGSIDVFLSSDGQSIPFGRNWVHGVEQALNRASLMLVFVTPSSVRSNWLYFEAGYAYSKGIRVVPVGLFGVDLSTVTPPLSLLQGFNVTSEAGLNNIVAIANDVFGHAHAESFVPDDFRAISSASGPRTDAQLGEHAGTLDQIVLRIGEDSLVVADPVESLRKIAAVLAAEGRDCDVSDKTLDVLGIRFFAQVGNGPDYLRVDVDPSVADVALPLVERAVRAVRKQGLTGLELRLDFINGIAVVKERHKITGRLYGSEARLAQENYLRYRNVEFSLGRLMSLSNRQVHQGGAYINIRLLEDVLSLNHLRDLLDLLFDREIVFFEA